MTTTWAYAYLSRDDRDRFAEQLAEAGRRHTVVWISGEAPGIVPAFAERQPPPGESIEPSVLGAIVYDAGTTRATTLAYVHPHGAALDWLAPPHQPA